MVPALAAVRGAAVEQLLGRGGIGQRHAQGAAQLVARGIEPVIGDLDDADLRAMATFLREFTALADNAMGYSCAQVTGWTTSYVTISLSIDFVGSAEIGPVWDRSTGGAHTHKYS